MRAAREHPGCTFANAVAETRQDIQLVYHEFQPAQTGPVVKSWLDHCYRPQVPRDMRGHRDEYEFLTIVLDEFMSGRFVEACDLVAGRWRYLTHGVESGQWESAK